MSGVHRREDGRLVPWANRSEVRCAVDCPECGSPAGKYCVTLAAKVRDPNHLNRQRLWDLTVGAGMVERANQANQA
jgi:hypothetical protein